MDPPISYSKFLEFRNDYFHNRKYPHQRFGQAFINAFNVGADPELFYNKSQAASERIILDRYVTYNSDSS